MSDSDSDLDSELKSGNSDSDSESDSRCLNLHIIDSHHVYVNGSSASFGRLIEVYLINESICILDTLAVPVEHDFQLTGE